MLSAPQFILDKNSFAKKISLYTEIMEKLQPEIEKTLEAPLSLKEEIELDKEISNIAKIYTNLQNDKIESGINYLLGETEKISLKKQDYASLEYLKGMLNLEIYNFFKNSPDSKKRKIASEHLDKSFSSFDRIVSQKEIFSIFIKIKGKDGDEDKEIPFGNLPLAMSYLGDIYAKRYLKENEKKFWEKSKELYQKSVKEEKDSGVKAEFETILAIRNIAETFGDEKNVWCEKTTKRDDIRNKKADLLLEYHDEKTKKTYSAYIDVTNKSNFEKEAGKSYLETTILDLSDGYAEPVSLADYDLKNSIEVAEKEMAAKGKYSKETSEKIFSFFKAFSFLEQRLAKDLRLNGASALNFKEDFFAKEEKLAKICPPNVDKKQFAKAILFNY